MTTNQERRDWVLNSVKSHPSYDEWSLENSITDLLTDLFHLIRHCELDRKNIIAKAEDHLFTETLEEREI